MTIELRAFWVVGLLVLGAGPTVASDCNQNGIEDALEIVPTLDFPATERFQVSGLPLDVALGDLDGDGRLDLATAGGSVVVALNRGGGLDSALFPVTATYIAGLDAQSLEMVDLDGDSDPDIAAVSPANGTISLLLNTGGVLEVARQVPAGGYPFFVAAGDLDADGDQDLVAANWGAAGVGPAGVSILFNEGGATFAPPVHYITRGRPECVVPADLDGDSDLDLVVADWGAWTGASYVGQGIVVFRNEGDGVFEVGGNYATGSFAEFADAADLDGDGDLDLVVVDGANEAVLVLHNTGDGAFPDTSRHTLLGEPRAVVARDLDGDGDPDAAAVDYYGKVFVFRNDGTGQLGAPATISAGDPTSFRIAAGDLDGDGDEDLVTGLSDLGRVLLLSNAGDATFTPAGRPALSAWSTVAIQQGDFDGDGHVDLAAVNSRTDNVSILRNGGDGTLVPRWTFAVGSGPASGVASDFDGDGLIDLATANRASGDVSVLLNDGRGSFRSASSFPAGTSPSDLVAGDLDGDSRIDLAVSLAGKWDATSLAHDGSGVALLPGDGRGGFEAGGVLPTGSALGSMVAVDLNGNGNLDLVVLGWYSADFTVFLGTGGGAFAPPATHPLPFPADSIASGDADGDGDLDIFLGGAYPAGFSLLRNDQGTLALAPDVFPPVSVRGLAVGDLDEDGDADVTALTGSAGEQLVLFRNDGTGVFEPGAALSSEFSSDSLLAVDLDGDGWKDVAVSSWSAGGVSVFRNVGAGTLRGASSFLAGVGPMALVTLDADGDGDLDLAAAKSAGGISVLLHGGGRELDQTLEIETSADPAFITAADLEGDGDEDLITLHKGELPSDVGPTPGVPGRVEVLLNRGGGAFERAPGIRVGFLPAAATAADMNGDGRVDLVVTDPGYYAFGGTQDSGVWVVAAGDDGAFDVPVNVGPGVSASSVAAVDYDGNGDLDLVVAGGEVQVLLNLGGLRFFPLRRYGFANSVLATDLDRDGGLDLLLVAYDHVDVLLQKGSGNFEDRFYRILRGGVAASTGDLDGDGAVDLAIVGPDVQVLPGDGKGGFVEPRRFVAGSTPLAIVSGDLDGDGRTDLAVSNLGMVSVLFNESEPARSLDANGNGYPDECDGVPFRRGDMNQDSTVNISDPIAILGHLFLGGSGITCLESADANDSGRVDISDAIFLLGHLFLGGTVPPGPGVGPACGLDPGPPGSELDLGCEEYRGC